VPDGPWEKSWREEYRFPPFERKNGDKRAWIGEMPIPNVKVTIW